MKYNLILGSGSPRRKELLSHLKIPFKIVTSDIEEKSLENTFHEIAEDLSMQKGKAVMNMVSDPSAFIVTSDTIVVLDNKIYGKPIDEEDSKSILNSLSGKTHKVITGVSVHFYFKEKLEVRSFHQITEVTFSPIDSDFLKLYLESKEGMDKAGSYGIQGMGLTFIEKINGSYSNVVGFPLQRFHEFMRQLFREFYNDYNYRIFFMD